MQFFALTIYFTIEIYDVHWFSTRKQYNDVKKGWIPIHTHTHLLMYCLLKCCDSIGGVPMGTGWLMMLGTSYAVKNIFLSNAAQRLSGDIGTRGRPSDRTQGWSHARAVWPTSERGRGYNQLHCPTLALLASNRDATVWRMTILVLSMQQVRKYENTHMHTCTNTNTQVQGANHKACGEALEIKCSFQKL